MTSRVNRIGRQASLMAALLAATLTSAEAQTHFTNCVSNTGNNASLFVSTAINPSINGRFLANGDEIAVFTPEGLCAGVKVWDGSNTAVTVWGDDSITSTKDGFAGGDSLYIHVWDSRTDVEFFPLNADFDVIYDGVAPFRSSPTYQSDALYNLTRLLVAEKDENRPPVASFTATPASSIDPFQMSFDGSASADVDGTVRNYLWNFGDGSTASGPNVTHTYSAAGNYTASLSVTDDDGAVGAATALLNITEPAPPENVAPSASFTATPAADGNGLKIDLNASSSSDPDGSISSYSWTFGDGTSGNGRTVSHTYSSGGTYTVRLTVRDNENATGTSSASITVTDPAEPTNQQPVASFTAAPTGAAEGMEFEFDASNSVDTDGSISSYRWNFGDGQTANGTSVKHTFAAAGSYTVRLTVTDNQSATGTASATINVTAPDAPSNRLPSASFTASQVSGGDAYTVRFDGSPSFDPDGTIASYAWDFGDDSSASGVSASHTYAGAGSYTVTLTVTDNSGGTATSTATIELTAPDPPANEAPLASFTAAPGSVALEISFDASASRDTDGSIGSYRWNFGDGATGSGQKPSHVYAQPGTYSVSLTVTDDDGSVGAATASVKVTAPEAPPSYPPLASFTASPVSGGDAYTMRFDASPSSDPDGSIASYSWSFGDDNSGTGRTTTHTYAGAGSYDVTLTVTDNEGNRSTATVTVELTEPDPPANQAPSASFTAAPGTADFEMSFDASASSDADGNIVSYRWNFGDGTTGFGRTASHTYAAGGSFNVSLTVTDDAGSVGTASATVRVSEPAPPSLPPAASFTAAPAGAGDPFTIRLDAGASFDADGSIVSYSWAFGDDNGGTGSVTTHTYAAVGTYQVTLTVTDNDGNTGRASATIEISDVTVDTNSPPAASFTASNGSTDLERVFDASASTDIDGTITEYRWDFGDGSTGTGQTATHLYSEPNTYVVTLTVVDDDGSVGTSSANVKISAPKGKNLPPTASLRARENHEGQSLSVELDASQSYDSDGSISTFAWDFGDGSSEDGPAVVHDYAAGGLYTVTLRVTDNEGASSIATINLDLSDEGGAENIPPSSSFTAIQNTTAGDYVMNFDGRASADPDGFITTFIWDFSDGTTETGEAVSHNFGGPGIYSVSLTVTDNRGTFSTSSSSITLAERVTAVDAPPAASFTALPASKDGPFVMTFDASPSVDAEGTITEYRWDFGDGSTDQGKIVKHSFGRAGDFTVKLFVTDDQDNVGTATAAVTLIDPKQNSVPSANFVVAPLRDVSPVAIALDASGSFDIDGAIGQYLWDFGDGKGGSGKRVTHEYDGSGTYIISLTITDNNGATASKADTVEVRYDLPDFLDLARIGYSTVRGSAEYQGDVLLIESGGALTTGPEDDFHYVYSPLTDDGEVVARVVSLEADEPWAAAGVMIRERLTPGSRFVSMVMTEEFGGSFQFRSSPSTEGTRQTPGGVGFVPYWVRLTRKGSTITGYTSIDGERWKVMGELEMDMASDIFIGVAAASNSDTLTVQASLDQIFIESSEPEPIEIPTEYDLSEVYPNPFNPQARFTLVLSREERVQVQVYDALGRLVRRLADDILTANTQHQFVLDASGLTSGLYIVRAEGESFEDVRKAILLK